MAMQYSKYDLVWEEDGQLVGYKAVVEAGIHVESITDSNLRGHIVKGSRAAFLQPRPALKRPIDLMWEEDGMWVGFKGAVNSRIDPVRVPESLACHLKPQDVTATLPHDYRPFAAAGDPMYVCTSSSVGHGVQNTVAPKLDTTQVWTGLSGKFTATFPSKHLPSGSLNCSINRHAVTKGPSFGTTPYFDPRAT